MGRGGRGNILGYRPKQRRNQDQVHAFQAWLRLPQSNTVSSSSVRSALSATVSSSCIHDALADVEGNELYASLLEVEGT